MEAQHNEAALAGPAPRLDLSVDGHVHTGFAKGRLSVGALVTAAEQAGLTQVTFADLVGPETTWLRAYLDSVRRAQKRTDLALRVAVEVEDMAQWVLSAEPMTVVDARDEHEWVAGHVPGAVHMYVPDVPHRAGEIPREAPVAVHCASGYRAGIAASLLEQAGLTRIIHVNGEYSDWDRLHLAESVPT